ncbi:MAG TPA: T9SS type A sorting domain-containing protein [Saprospiraceae bacterium]|nr:T9SS type A sorting domain-containing protein [Saprospiraceae bacterium]HNT22144.1 T9SS type A sorting domain-containing protein [Saprospiraceae bacterium]
MHRSLGGPWKFFQSKERIWGRLFGSGFVTPEGTEVNAKSELFQNYPNPFDQRTLIGFRLAKEGRGTLSIHDVTGRTLRSIEKDWTKGYHEVRFDRKEIGATGVLYYRFESGFFTDSKKMVVLE